ncbi:unnamed protein product [Lasius platythorax]|uniref:Uncharacterized protein n=1 Tax=Lasius platythorax TaxID=488582 RepID=A0AAV2N0F4_9HYME
MYSDEDIGWSVEDNSVEDRMIDNSLIHKFMSSAKIRKRTKILNTKIKKYSGVKDYKHYIKLKTNVVRNVVEDTDTDNSDNLSDTDYDMIYNSLIQTKSSVDNSKRYIFTEEDCKGFERKINTKHKEKNNIKNTKASIPKKKSLQAKCNTSASKKRIGWQKVTKKNKDKSHLSNNQTCTNKEENIVKNNNDYLQAQSNNQSLSLPFDSQNSTTSNIVKSVNENMRESYIDSNAVVNESNSQNSTIFNEIKTSESEIQDYKQQNAVIDKSNTKLDSQNPPDSPSKYLASSSKSSLKNIKSSDDEISTVIKLENNNSNTYESHKSKLLKNVRRNLTPVLEEALLMNNDKDIEEDKNEENGLNYSQLLVPTTSCTRHSTPIKKTRTNVAKNLSPDTSSMDQQKDSGFDEDSQDRFVKIEQSNIRSSTNPDIAEKMLVSPQQYEKIAEVETTTSENSKENTNNDNILEKQDNKEEKEFSREEEEEKNSSQLNPIDKDIKQEVRLTNQENKTKFVKAEEDIEKQQSLSPKENHAKDAHSKSCDNILKKQDIKEKESSSEGKVRNSLRLNEADKDADSINHENKNDLLNQSLHSYKMHSTEPEDSCQKPDIQKQQSLSPKEDHVKDIHSKSCNNILEEQDSRKKESFKEEITDFFQSNQIDKDAEIYSINHQDKTHSMKLEDSCNIKKQQLLPKITYTEIINKKFAIIKQDNDINIEKNDIDSQEEISKAEEIDTNTLTLETDNEEDNANYISPETKKRLQQQARLNLVVSSDSSQSDDEYVIVETSRKHDDDSDTSCCTKDMFENDETNCEKTNTDISCSKDSSKEATPVPIKEKVKIDSPNIKKEIRKQADKTVLLTSCIYENNNSSKSDANKNSLKEIQYCENVYNDDDNQNKSIEDESFQLRVSESNISCISEESKNQSSLLDKENFCNKSNQGEDRMSNCISELETGCKSRHEENKQVSTKCSNAHFDISCHYRPYNYLFSYSN